MLPVGPMSAWVSSPCFSDLARLRGYEDPAVWSTVTMVVRETFLEIPVALAAFAVFAAHFCLPRTAAEAKTCGAHFIAVMRAGAKWCPMLTAIAWHARACGLSVFFELETFFRVSLKIGTCKRLSPQWDDPIDHEDAQEYATELKRVILHEAIRWSRFTRSDDMTEGASLLADLTVMNTIDGYFDISRMDYAIDDRGEAVSMAAFFYKASAAARDQQPWERTEHRPESRHASGSHSSSVGNARTRKVNAEHGNASGMSAAAAAATAPQPTAGRRSERRPKKASVRSAGHRDDGSGLAVHSTLQSHQSSGQGLSGSVSLDVVGGAAASHAGLYDGELDGTQAAAGEVSDECLVCWEQLGALELGRAPQFCDHELCMSCASKVLCCPFCGVPRTGTPRGLARAVGIPSTMSGESGKSVGGTVTTSAAYAHTIDDYVDD